MFIQIEKNKDGSHAYQLGGNLEPGWAAVPEDMVLPDSFPYVELEAELVTHPAVTGTREVEVDGQIREETVVLIPEYTQMEVVSMTEGQEIPVEATEESDAGQDETVYDELAEAYNEGVQSA